MCHKSAHIRGTSKHHSCAAPFKRSDFYAQHFIFYLPHTDSLSISRALVVRAYVCAFFIAIALLSPAIISMRNKISYNSPAVVNFEVPPQRMSLYPTLWLFGNYLVKVYDSLLICFNQCSACKWQYALSAEAESKWNGAFLYKYYLLYFYSFYCPVKLITSYFWAHIYSANAFMLILSNGGPFRLCTFSTYFLPQWFSCVRLARSLTFSLASPSNCAHGKSKSYWFFVILLKCFCMCAYLAVVFGMFVCSYLG